MSGSRGCAEAERLVTPNAFSAARDELLTGIERAVAAIEQGGKSAELHNLELMMFDVLRLIERDPGIETATQDLYDAAARFALDPTWSVPLVRQQRLLRDARARYRERLTGARPGQRTE